MKKILTLYVMPLLAVIIIIVKIPDVDNYLKKQSDHAVLIIGIVIAFFTLLTHYITVVSPFKKYEKIERNKWAMLEVVISNYGNNYFKKNKLAVNVMIAKKCFFNRREPRKNNKLKFKNNFFQKMLKVIWTYNGMPIDKRLALTVKQGSSGMAYTYGKAILVDPANDSEDEINLNEEQKKAIKSLEFIISCPIFALDEQYNKLSTKIIGIINVSCSYPNSKHLIEKPEFRHNLTSKVMEFSKICSLIM